MELSALTTEMEIEDLYGLLNHPDLSWKAKGLGVAIIMNQDLFSSVGPNKIEILVDMGPEKGVSIRSGLRELESVGFLKMTQHRSVNKRRPHVVGSSWEIDLDFDKDKSNLEEAG